jgi:hypothetical protein
VVESFARLIDQSRRRTPWTSAAAADQVADHWTRSAVCASIHGAAEKRCAIIVDG